jgi:hypothetical protein
MYMVLLYRHFLNYNSDLNVSHMPEFIALSDCTYPAKAD